MGPHGPSLLLGVLLLLGTALTEDVKIVNGFVGGTIKLVPVFDGDPQGFEWKKGTDKIIEVDFPGDPVHYNLFTNRSHFNHTSGVLTVVDLQPNDTGEYSAHVLINQTYQKTTFNLAVFPALHKPTLNCTATDTSVVIRCRHDPEPSTYEWYHDPVTSNRHNSNLTDRNRSLTVSRAYLKSLKSLECVVKNPATENRTSVQETCYGTESQSRSRFVLIAAVVTALFISFIFYGICGPEHSFLHRFFNPLRNQTQVYQLTARSEPEGERKSRRAINSEGGQSDNMNKDGSRDGATSAPETTPADSNTHQKGSGGSGDQGATSAPATPPPDSTTHQNNKGGSGDEGATSAPATPAPDSTTLQNNKELENESHEQHALIHNTPHVQTRGSLNTAES